MNGLIKLLEGYSEMAVKNGFKTPQSNISEHVKDEIRNILQNDDMANFIICMTEHGAIGESDNIGNKFEIEREVKILDIDKEVLEKKLLALNAQKIFTGTVDDIYLDYDDDRLDKMEDKISFRIRFKYNDKNKLSMYYTIKRKIPKDKNLEVVTRDCFEKEFEIVKPKLAFDILGLMKLHAKRRKTKMRVAYVLGSHLKFDIDTYKDINTLLEIETDRVDQIPGILTMLELSDHETSSGGARSLFALKGVKYNMLEDSETGLLIPAHLHAA